MRRKVIEVDPKTGKAREVWRDLGPGRARELHERRISVTRATRARRVHHHA